MVKRAAVQVVEAAELTGEDGPAQDSDEEALENQRALQPQANIVQSDLVLQEGVDVYIVEAKSKKRIRLFLGQDNVICAVCGQSGHTAGFVGAVYVDCPVKPCYLCKKLGHTAATCPHRMDPTHSVTPLATSLSQNLLSNIQQREICIEANRLIPVPAQNSSWKIRSVIQKLHEKRVTCMDFPPRSLNLVTTACKRGRISVWDFEEVSEHTSFQGVHKYQINSLKFIPGRDSMSLLTACCLGHTCLTDIETGMHNKIVDLNPEGWIEGVSSEKTWTMMCSIGVHHTQGNTAWCGDNKGKVRCLDLRGKNVEFTTAIHGSGKITSLEFHPHDSNLMLTAGNDHCVKLFDVRKLKPSGVSADTARKGPAESLLTLAHPRVISKATFSPHTGRRIVSTCADNRLRVWDDVLRACDTPDREIVHSHDFNRYLTNFQAVFDPKDSAERTMVIGRYISEVRDGYKLHPIDFVDVGTGATIRSLIDPNLTYINPVNMPHPLLDVVVTGSSGSLFCWRPEPGRNNREESRERVLQEEDEEEAEQEEEKPVGAGPSSKQDSITGSRFFSVFEITPEGKKEKKSKGKRK